MSMFSQLEDSRVDGVYINSIDLFPEPEHNSIFTKSISLF
jgi:hypothetical protein